MKKFLSLVLIIFVSICSVYAATDKLSKEYLQNKKHFSITKPLAESVAKKALQSALKKETGAKFDVKIEGYTTSSLKAGVFKYLEITGRDVVMSGIPVPYINLRSLTDYNYIDYTKNPVAFKSDMVYAYELYLSDESINASLKDEHYQKVINTVNKIAGSMFVIKDIRTKIVNNKLYLIMDYNLPIIKLSKDRSFIAATDFDVTNGKITAQNVHIDTAYGNIGLNKVANLINLLNPLEFTLNLIDENRYKGNVENIKFVDNKIKINGKIKLKGEGK